MFQRVLVTSLLVGAAVASIDCGGDDASGDGLEITVSVNPASMLADGVSSAVVTVEAGSYSGPMQIATTQGYLTPGLAPDGTTLRTINVTVTDGKTQATLRSCDFEDPAQRPCGGGVRVTASAESSQGVGFATFSCNGECPTNEGGSGGGGEGGSGGGGEGGSGGSGGVSGTYTLKLTTSRDVVRNLFEVTSITATVLKDGKEATETGSVHFTFTAPGEAFIGATRPPTGAEADVPLDRSKAIAYFTGEGVDTTATVTATYKNGTGSVDVRLDPGGDLAKILVAKNSNPVVGVRGSINEKSSELIFALSDQADVPMPPGIPVTFKLTSTSNDSLEPYEAVTDDDGRVRTVFTPGGFPGSAGIRATAKNRSGTDVQTTATVIVQNGVPSQRDIAFVCDANNRFMTLGCATDKVSCAMLIGDRANANASQGIDVSFMAEVGQIDPSAKIDGTGAAKIDFLSKGVPKILAPDGDPRSLNLVTFIGYTKGEEQFEDCNANGFYDSKGGGGPAGTVCANCDDWRGALCDAEPFTDIAEPFVDSDGNGVQNGDEKFVPGSQPGNTENWDGPNGVWDADTNVWASHTVVWIASPATIEFLNPPSPMPACSDLFQVRFVDAAGNCVNPDNTGDITVKVKTTGVQGTFNWPSSKVKVGGCFDFSPDAQTYPLSFQVTSKPPPDTDPWPITLEVSGNYTQSCDARQSVLATITCDGLR